MKEGWTYKRLGDVAYYPTQRISSELMNETNYVGVDNMIKDRGGKTLANFIPSEGNAIQYLKGDILLGNIRPYLKKIWLSDSEGGASGDVLIIRPKDTKNLCSNYLYWVLASDMFFEYDTLHCKGAKMPRGNKDDIMKYQLPVPTIEAQQQIVSELELLSFVIEKQKAQIEELDKLAQSTFYEMFGDPVTNEKSWEIKQLGDVSDITSSKRIFANEYREDGIPFYRGKEITEKSKGQEISLELFISEERYEEIKESFGVPSIGDILITAVGTIGNIWVVNDTNPFYFKDGNIIWVKEFKNIDPTYFKSVLTILIATYKSEMANGCAYNALTIVNLKKMSFALPPLALQQEFAAKIEAIEQMKAKVRQSLKETEELFNSRMDYYFN